MAELETLEHTLRQLVLFAERSSGLEARAGDRAPRNGTLSAEIEAALELFPTRIPALNGELIACLTGLAGIGELPPESLLLCLFQPTGELRAEAKPSLGPLARIPLLRQALGSQLADWRVGTEVATALLPFLEEDPQVEAAFLEALAQEPPEGDEVRKVVATIVPMPEVFRDRLVDTLLLGFDEEAEATAQALAGSIPSDPWVRMALFESLHRREVGDQIYRMLAAHAHLPPVKDRLFDLLDDPQDLVRWRATAALSEIAVSDDTIALAFRELLADEDEEIRVEAALALRHRPDADPEVERVLETSRQGTGWIARQLRSRLARENRPNASEASEARTTPDFEALGQDPSEAETNGELSTAEEARDALRDQTVALSDSIFVLDSFTSALERLSTALGPRPPVLELLEQYASHPHPSVHHAARRALGRPAPPRVSETWARLMDPRSTESLIRFLDEDDPTFIAHRIRTDTDGPRRSEDRRRLLRFLEHPAPLVRSAAIDVLDSRVRDPTEVRSRLLQACDDESFAVRLTAIRALCRPSRPKRRLDEEIWSRVLPWLAVDTDAGWVDTGYGRPDEVRETIARRVGEQLPRDPDLRRLLRGDLRSERFSRRLGAIFAFLEWKGGLPKAEHGEVLEAFADRRGLERLPKRLHAARVLAEEELYRPEILDLCLETTSYGTRIWEEISHSAALRARALEILDLAFRPFPPQIRHRLEEILQSDPDPGVRDKAYLLWSA